MPWWGWALAAYIVVGLIFLVALCRAAAEGDRAMNDALTGGDAATTNEDT